MPLYEYKCGKCGHRFEKIENVKSSLTKKCPKCGAKAERQITAAAIQFKGSGWYVTDYAGKSTAPGSSDTPPPGDKAGSNDKSDSAGKSDDSKSSKPEQKSGESKPTPAKESPKKKK